jgi:hypothetical protein
MAQELNRMRQSLHDVESKKLQPPLGLSTKPRLRQPSVSPADSLTNAAALPQRLTLDSRLAAAAPHPLLPVKLLDPSASKPLLAFHRPTLPRSKALNAEQPAAYEKVIEIKQSIRQDSASSQNSPVNPERSDANRVRLSGDRSSIHASVMGNVHISDNAVSGDHVIESMLALYKARVRSSSKLRAFVLLPVFLIYPTLDPGARFSPRILSFSAGGAKIQLHLCFAIAFVSDAFALPSTQQMLIMLRAELLSSGRSIDEADQLLADACVSPRLHQ